MRFPLLYTVTLIQRHYAGINRSVHLNVFLDNDNIFTVSSAIYRRILEIEGLITCNHITLLISVGIPFFLFKYHNTGILILPTSDSSTISEQWYKLSVYPSSTGITCDPLLTPSSSGGCYGLLVFRSLFGTITFPSSSNTPHPYP